MQEVSGSSPLSSTGQKRIRTGRTGSTAAKYSNGGRSGRRTCIRIGISPRARMLTGQRIQMLNRHWPAFHLRKSTCHRSRDSCHRITTRPPGGPFLQRLLPHLQVVQPRWPSWRSAPLPGATPAGHSRAFADGRIGARARRIAPIVSHRRGAHSCAAPLRRRVALWRSPARLPARHLRSQARRSARDVAGCQPSGDPVRALTLPRPCLDQVLAAVDSWMAAVCRCAARAVPEPRRDTHPCRFRAAQNQPDRIAAPYADGQVLRAGACGARIRDCGADLLLLAAAWGCHAAIWYSCVSPPRTCLRRIRCSAR